MSEASRQMEESTPTDRVLTTSKKPFHLHREVNQLRVTLQVQLMEQWSVQSFKVGCIFNRGVLVIVEGSHISCRNERRVLL